MELTSLLGYILVGLLFGWISSTLVEWVWYRGRHRRIDLAMAPSGMRVSQPLAGGPVAHSYGAPELPARTASDRGASAADATPQKGRRRARKNAQPGQPAGQAPANQPDNLTAIYGIGDLYERRLYQVGIFTWDQLSRVDAETLQQITRALPGSNTPAWIEQARELAQANNRVGAFYDGPLPEDLTRINGVDQVYEDELYAAGIFTFRQLTECAPDELASIIPAHLAGEELDFASWIAQADSLRDEYYSDEPPIL
jgi:predicted flap endonuclease-1-like 5' DNA nuclease